MTRLTNASAPPPPVSTVLQRPQYWQPDNAPAVGFLHTGKPLSFVYDIADIYKFDTVIPIAFKVAASQPATPDRQVRLACRDLFRSEKILKRLIPLIEEVLAAGEIAPPKPPEDAVPPAIPEPSSIGDVGHRSG